MQCTHNHKVDGLQDKPLRVAIVAGEASGDILGAGLVSEIKKLRPDAQFEGIGGPLMIEQGFKSLYPMERLSVMGLFEVLGRIFELICIRRGLRKRFVKSKPDVFIGIDAPDFNIGLELQLRNKGIKTVHYVSPSVWAWRQKRVFKIARAVDLMLTLFPFEAKFYKEHNVAVKFVGHPLADLIPMRADRQEARKKIGLDAEKPVLGILPGSRAGEISRIGSSFLDAAQLVRHSIPDVQCVIPCINEERKAQVDELLRGYAGLPVKTILGRSRDVMAASNVVLLASGTATLECMLMKRPMVVAYRVNTFTHWLMKRLLKSPFVSLPNLLAGKELVPELLQDDATQENIADAVLTRMPERAETILKNEFESLHNALRLNASVEAAHAVLAITGKK